jgi:glycosyltransferase involved in cell wall biosynthesis
MIVKNEESCLATALDSVAGADEIIVCDTGSTDNTIEIAKRYTDKVFTDFVWCDDFAKARNHANSKATGDWILVIDADEHLEPGGVELIKAAAESAKLAINCLIKANKGQEYFQNTRAYRNCPEVFWVKPIHNHLNVSADSSCDAKIVYGYSEAHKLDPDRALRILSKYVDEHPDCVRELYYLAREYWYRKQYEEAVQRLELYVKRSTHVAERADAYLMQARCLWALHRGEEARQSCMNAILNNANFKEAVLFMSELHWRGNATTWKKFARFCTNEGVLFKRVR